MNFHVINDIDGAFGCPVGWIMCYYDCCTLDDVRTICDSTGRTHYDGSNCYKPRSDRPANAHIGTPEMFA
jgi:hypothetical protein